MVKFLADICKSLDLILPKKIANIILFLVFHDLFNIFFIII